MRFPFLAITVVLISSSFIAQAKMYKWVDDEGNMHFGDKIPQKYQAKAHDELDERGMKVKHQEAEKTAEEKAEIRRLEREGQKAANDLKKQQNLDRILLDAYSDERELIVARDSRLDAVAIQIQLSEAIIIKSNKKIKSMEKQVADIEASNREVPINLYKSIDSEKQQIVVQNRVMAKHKKRSDEISEKYNGYIERFRAAKSR